MSSKALVRHQRPKASEWDQLVSIWLHGRPQSTQDMYRPVITTFRKWIQDKPISQITLQDLQDFADTLAGQKPRTRERKLCTLKSLTGFCHKTGFIPFDVGAALRLPKIADDLASKLLSPADIAKMIDAEPKLRNKVLMETLFSTGIRASEAAGLDWKDLQPRGKEAGQISVFGKGGRTRSIIIPKSVWKALQTFRPPEAGRDTAVFMADNGRRLTRNAISIIVSRAGRRVNIGMRVSSHTCGIRMQVFHSPTAPAWPSSNKLWAIETSRPPRVTCMPSPTNQARHFSGFSRNMIFARIVLRRSIWVYPHVGVCPTC